MVILSIGRHESYYGNQNLPLNNEGLAKAWLSGKVILDLLGKPEVIYSSPLARAVATAELRAATIGNGEIFIDNLLTEDASLADVQAFLYQLFDRIADSDIKHIHIVTHAPTATKLNNLDFTPLDTGDIMVWKADNWQNMSEGKYQTGFLRTTEYFNPEKLSQTIGIVKNYHGLDLSELIKQLR